MGGTWQRLNSTKEHEKAQHILASRGDVLSRGIMGVLIENLKQE